MKKQIFNNQLLKERRQRLRSVQTKPESLMWSMLRNRRIVGLKFLRQYSVGPYVLDFYCPKLRLCVEIDGGYHFEEEQIKYDSERTKYINTFNITVIRFTNQEVIHNIDGVYQRILELCEGKRTSVKE